MAKALVSSFQSLALASPSSSSSSSSACTSSPSSACFLASRSSGFSGVTFRFNPQPSPAHSLKHAPPRSISASAATLAEERESIEKFVKAAMPGGIAAQKLLGTGRRKTAVARVCLLEGTGRIIINCRTAQEYLQGNPLWLQYVKYPLVSLGYESKYDVIVKAEGGGLSGQAQAILLGISRALCKANPANRDPLKKLGLLTRDPRAVERKKAGLHKARKAPQYSKR